MLTAFLHCNSRDPLGRYITRPGSANKLIPELPYNVGYSRVVHIINVITINDNLSLVEWWMIDDHRSRVVSQVQSGRSHSENNYEVDVHRTLLKSTSGLPIGKFPHRNFVTRFGKLLLLAHAANFN